MSKGLLTVVPLLALAALGARPAQSSEIMRPHAAGPVAPAATPQSFTCVPTDLTVCLFGGRFEVAAKFTAPNGGAAGSAHMVKLTDDSAYMWFFSSDNVEAVLKVLDGCALNSSYWFFAGGLTNVDVVITLTDSTSGAIRQYHNPQGTPFSPLQDTSALKVCP
jgi:hypothetical protein